MEKKWLFVVGIVIVMIIASISFMSIIKTTGSFVYGKCWKTEQISDENTMALRIRGCIVEESSSRVCCPFETCPEINGVNCQ